MILTEFIRDERYGLLSATNVDYYLLELLNLGIKEVDVNSSQLHVIATYLAENNALDRDKWFAYGQIERCLGVKPILK